MLEQRSRTQDHDLLAGAEHRLGDPGEEVTRRAFDHEVGKRLELFDRRDRHVDVELAQRRLRLRLVARRDGDQLEARHPGREPGDERPADHAKSRDGDAHHPAAATSDAAAAGGASIPA